MADNQSEQLYMDQEYLEELLNNQNYLNMFMKSLLDLMCLDECERYLHMPLYIHEPLHGSSTKL